jgi:hypothetical protein
MRNPDDPTASTDSPPRGQGPDESTRNGERSFYGRWSRRKREVRDGVVAVGEDLLPASVAGEAESGDVPETVSEQSPAGDSATVDEPVLTDADMPPLETLGDDDDYSGFMSPGVSEGLRNQALRKLFMSSQFNVLDGLNDYDDDFRNFEALGDIITSDMRHRMEMEAERAKREAEEKARALLNDESEAERADDAGEGALPGESALAGAGADADQASPDDNGTDRPGDEDSGEPRDV